MLLSVLGPLTLFIPIRSTTAISRKLFLLTGHIRAIMVRASKSPSSVKSGLGLTVSWRAPRSTKWQPYEDSIARAMLAAYASGQATFEVKDSVRRSPRMKALQPARTATKRAQRKTKRARAEAE